MLKTPFKVRNHVERILSLPKLKMQFFLAGIRWGEDWRVFGTPILQRYGGSSIELGPGLELRSSARSNPLTPRQPVVLSTRSASARIRIGNQCGLTGAVLVAQTAITLGNRVLVGANSTIIDTDFHPLSAEQRKRDINGGASSPVVIEDDVFIGANVMILKGVRVGKGSVVGAGSVVARDVPANSLVAGNPARVIRSL